MDDIINEMIKCGGKKLYAEEIVLKSIFIESQIPEDIFLFNNIKFQN